MADNLAISITADTTSLQAQLALARAEVLAYGSEVRKVAAEIRSGDIGKFDNLEQSVGQLAAAKAQVGALTAELGIGRAAHLEHARAVEEHKTALAGLKGVGSEAAGGIREIGSSLLALGGLGGGIGAIAGLFAVEGLVEFVKGTAEAAEKTENMAAAVGMAPSKYALLGLEMKLAGGDAETLQRTLTVLETKLKQAVENPSSTAREAFLKMGISVEEMKKGLSDIPGFLQGLPAAFQGMPEGVGRTDAFVDILSRRQYANLIPFLRKDPEELQGQVKDALGGNLPTDEGIHKLAEYQEKINTLGVAFGGLKKAIVSSFIDPLTQATETTTSWVKDTRRAVDDVKGLLGTASTVGGAGVGAVVGGTVAGPIGALAGAAIGAAAGLDGLTAAAKEVKNEFGQLGSSWKWFSEKWDDLQEGLGHGRPSGTYGGWRSGNTTEDVLLDHAGVGMAGTGVGFGTREQREGTAASGNKERVASWLAAHGYDDAHAAAVLGNASVESSFDPARRNASGHFGLFQWDRERQQPLGGSTDIDKQMALMDAELTKLDPAFKTASGSIEELTKRFEQKFERSGGQLEGRRESEARAAAGGGLAVNPALEQKDLDRQIKQLTEWAKVEAAGYDIGIQKAKQDSQETNRLEQQKIEMLQRTAAQEQAIRDRFAAGARDRGNAELAEKYQTGGGSLQEKELQAERQLIALKQRSDEERARLDISKSEVQRKGADAREATDLRRVDGARRTGDLTIAAAEAKELEIVQKHAEKVASILAQEQQQAAGIEKLQVEVANRAQEEYQKEQEARQRIKDKAQQEEAQRGHAVDAELAGAASGAIVNAAWGKGGGIGQQISGFIQGQEKKALDAVFTKLLDASGVGKLFSSIGDKLFSFLPGAASGAAANAPVVAAITAQTAQQIADTAAIVAAIEASGALIFAKPEVLGTSLLGGGVIPSAAGGMTVNDGRGGTLAIVHPNEMVLPSHLSLGIQDMIGRGGWSIPRAPAAAGISPSFAGGAAGGGSGGDQYHVSISAFDGHSVERMLLNNPAAVAKAFSRARRSFSPHVPS